MANVGDRITIAITGPGTLSGASTATGLVSIGGGATISVSGVILQDLGTAWLVQLDISIGGNNRISVPKSSVR